jgi:predicted metal-dependent hydrolase
MKFFVYLDHTVENEKPDRKLKVNTMDAREHNFVELKTTRGRHIKVLATVHPRARLMSLSVGVTGPRLSTPKGTLPSAVKAFLREHADWLETKLREMERQGVRLVPPIPGVPDTFTWRGETLLVKWEQGAFPRVRVEDNQVCITMDLEHSDADAIARRAMRAFVAAQMKREVARLSQHYAEQIGKDIRATRLLPMKSLWGSLSVAGHMTLDLSLMLAPQSALEYVVVHEMCHLWVRNHGRRFWQRVEDVFPNYHEQRDWLSRQGHRTKAELARWIGTELLPRT